MKTITEQRSISSGTMRSEDLVPAFISELSDAVDRLASQSNDSKALIARIIEQTDAIEARADVDGYYETEEVGYDMDSLFDLLNEVAGDGLYFGSHPGDGADYGFWQSEAYEGEQPNEPEAYL